MTSKRGRTGREVSMYLDNDVADALERRAKALDRKRGWVASNALRSPLGLPPKEIK